ncbi:LacI family DNA-binding transcriptional regulator [Clostridium fallax]|uniref:Transcriptional regulator, LacI family n=1 Tax=Clostridium fallax TaxID=1533 RepID=A0A1M4XB04_9CLOT|nr:LacI family DNA-binding transcriptional regulator [Clostridium fallax]SHE90581.1 transcriptional regulator, LacI family [Clostridium fallax]SQB06003.1 LacI family transcriptional regulator [Clostridium fallax]
MNIKDVAKIAKVGVSTVSRVINNHPDVKEETREKVLKIIKEVNYIPNNSARILKKHNTNNIGILLKGVFNPFFSEMLKIISGKIEKAGYTMILRHYDHTTSQDVDTVAAFAKEKRLQGIICLGGNFLNINENSFDDINIPIVLTSANIISENIGSKVSFIGIDNEKAAFEATEYLIRNGHKNIALILGTSDDVGVGNLRLKGYKKALIKNNIPFKKELILYGGYECKKSYSSVKKLLNNKKFFTAIFAISDLMAIGACKAVFDENLKVCRDISIIGFDGMEIGEFYEPSITTIKQPRDEMAKKSVDLLLKLIYGKENNKHLILNTNLVERDSCRKI